MLSQLSEKVPARKCPLFGEYFISYGAKYVEIMKKLSKTALINGLLWPFV